MERCDGYLLYLLSNRELTTQQWHNLLAIYVTDKKTGKPLHDLPMLGKYSIKDQQLHFIPRFPFKAGINYLAKFNIPYFYALLEKNVPLSDWQKIVELRFKLTTALVTTRPIVKMVYPGADTLPVNQLKMYIHFSSAMQEGVAYDHIQVLDQDGKPVDQPFLELSPELWDIESKRLTIWFDPGRIKRGLNPNVLKGLPLKEGEKYTLQIAPGLRDKTGQPLEKAFRKDFFVTEADRTAPVVSNWTIHIPASSTETGLSIRFDEPMDHALLNRMISITDGGKEIPGKIKVTDDEKVWTFEPQKPWSNASYQIRINTKIEDLAGNSLRRLFDAPVSNKGHRLEKEKELIIPVKIAAKAKRKKVRKYQFRTLPK